jgi:hemolysin activation/secretion protein
MLGSGVNIGCTKRIAITGGVLAFMALSGAAIAQTVPIPNPGTIANQSRERQQAVEQQSLPRVNGLAVVGPTAPEQLVGPPGGATFLLKQVVFDQSNFVTQMELNAIATRFVGKQIDNSGLQLLVKLVNDLFAERRIITALAYLPKQDLRTGVLHIAIIEGHVGKVEIKGNDRLRSSWVETSVPLTPGAVVNVPKVEDDVAYFNAGHIAQVQATLQPGSQFGLTDVTLGVLEPPRNSIQAYVDNEGVDSVGTLEGGLNFQHYGLLGIDDRFTASVLGSAGNQNVNLGYNVAADPWGGRIGVSAGTGQIHVVSGPYTALVIRGTSENEAVNAAQPLFATSNWVYLVNGQVARELSISNQSGVEVTKNTTWKETIGSVLRYSDATFNVALAPNLSFGQTSFGLTNTTQTFAEITGTLNSSAKLPLGFTGILNGAWQWANQKLLSSEQLFQAGGPTSVRGYSSDSAAGYAGFYTNLELHHKLDGLKEDVDAFAFYDHGTVYSTFPATLNLDSVGGGFSWNLNRYFVADVSVGVPVRKTFDRQPDATVYLRLTSRWP